MLNESLYSSASTYWETPNNLFQLLNDEFSFEIDVCANESNHKCDKYFTEEDNALIQEWRGTCWMNPPYGKNIKYWIKKAYESTDAVTVCLLPARTDTRWWHDYCMKGEVRFINKRLKFVNSSNMATFPSAIVIFNNGNIGKMSALNYR